MKKALITGVTGQDGSHLAEFLLKKNYIVHGLQRTSSWPNTNRIEHIISKYKGTFKLHQGDLTDALNIANLIQNIQPDEIYNLGAMSHVHASFDQPIYTTNVNALGLLHILEAVKNTKLGNTKLKDKCRIYQASTSELFGLVQETPQTEKTPFYPRSPYGVSKLYAYWIGVNYREAYGMFVSNGILFNHESSTRGHRFVTRKITRAVAKIHLGHQDKLYLGNLSATRDWGHIKDCVKAIHAILQHDKPDDFVIATGISTSVRDFVKMAFKEVGVGIVFEGKDANEVGKCSKTDKILVEVDPKYFRPAEVLHLEGDASKAKQILGWENKTDLQALVKEMVCHDLASLKR